MSYILDALRKSESERRQGRVPDLGVSVQMVHKPRRRRIHWSVWLTAALLANAAVFGAFYWQTRHPSGVAAAAAGGPGKERRVGQGSGTVQKPAAPTEGANRPVAALPVSSAPLVSQEPVTPGKPSSAAVSQENTAGQGSGKAAPTATAGDTLIRPHQPPARVAAADADATSDPTASPSTIPELAEMPLSFQRQVPDLHFNGHIYASNPGARRVMIDNVYLAQGDRFRGLRIVEITRSGVIMSLDGQLFRVGVVQDWIRPN